MGDVRRRGSALAKAAAAESDVDVGGGRPLSRGTRMMVAVDAAAPVPPTTRARASGSRRTARLAARCCRSVPGSFLLGRERTGNSEFRHEKPENCLKPGAIDAVTPVGATGTSEPGVIQSEIGNKTYRFKRRPN